MAVSTEVSIKKIFMSLVNIYICLTVMQAYSFSLNKDNHNDGIITKVTFIRPMIKKKSHQRYFLIG